MSKVMLSESYLEDIADAIRSKKGTQDTYTPAEMAEAIESISGGGITPTGTISITSNGIVDVTQYASANVAVPSVTPTGTINITQNGTVDVTNYASASVAVPNPSTGTKQISITQNGTTTEDVTNYANAEITVNVPVGQTVYYTTNGIPYAKELELPCILQGVTVVGVFDGATELEKVVCNDDRLIGGSNGTKVASYFRNCTKLKTVNFPYLQGIKNGYVEYFLGGCTALENATFGSIGYPISEFANTNYSQKVFSGTTQNTLTITMYVNAQSIADVPTAITTYAPWGATGATIVYKNYLTGAVLT